MFHMIWPMGLVVVSNIVYNICAKFTPQKANPFLSLTTTYVVAALVSFILYSVSGGKKDIISDVLNLNVSAVLLGISIIGLEFGYIYIYRSGWNMSTGSLVANICLACALLVIGVLFFKEHLNIRQLFGMVLCAIGLFLITN